MSVSYEWRGRFGNVEIHALHAEAFATRVFDESEWDWVAQVEQHSLGWVVARQRPSGREIDGRERRASDDEYASHAGDQRGWSDDGALAGFANVLWDGLVHAWLQDVMVAESARHLGIGRELVSRARDGAAEAGCEYLHVDFEAHLAPFYVDACGFEPTSAGLLRLQ